MVKVGEYELREDLYYWPKGLTWAKVESDRRMRVGLTDLGQRLATKIRFIRILPKGRAVDQGKMVATMETGKWIGPVESPVSGTIDEVNAALRGKPTLINDDPYGEGWVVLLNPTKPEEIENLVHGEAIFEWYKKEIETRIRQKK